MQGASGVLCMAIAACVLCATAVSGDDDHIVQGNGEDVGDGLHKSQSPRDQSTRSKLIPLVGVAVLVLAGVAVSRSIMHTLENFQTQYLDAPTSQ
mgnify:CR=1 FL=1